MATPRPLLTVLMPAYNEEAGLAHSVEQVLAKLRELAISAELLIVDDCSRDRTGAIADALAAQPTGGPPLWVQPEVRVIHHPVTRGIGGGMITGFAQAKGEWLILIPADLALDLDELRKYLDAAQDADLVLGLRSDRRDYTLFRKIVSWINIRSIQWLFGMKQQQFNYISMYRLDALREIDIEYWRGAFFYAEIIIKAKALNRRLKEIQVRYVPRASGEATGAKPGLVLRTARDMLRFWWRWVWLGSRRAALS